MIGALISKKGDVMNITLSADATLVEKVKCVAQKKGTSLNQLIRGYFNQLVDEDDEAKERRAAADEFVRVAKNNAGCSSAGWKFNRDDIYDRH
jgi:hypothetical protein